MENFKTQRKPSNINSKKLGLSLGLVKIHSVLWLFSHGDRSASPSGSNCLDAVLNGDSFILLLPSQRPHMRCGLYCAADIRPDFNSNGQKELGITTHLLQEYLLMDTSN